MAERRRRRLLQALLSGSKNIRFAELVTCAKAFGFQLSRINGSHHIYVHPEVPELINLQNVNAKLNHIKSDNFFDSPSVIISRWRAIHEGLSYQRVL